MKLVVFVCLLFLFKVAAGSCINKTVEVLVGNGIGLTGDVFGDPEPYVVVYIDGETKTTRVIDSNSNPSWWKTLKFNSISNDFMTIEVWDQDSGLNGPDDLLATCTERLSYSSSETAVQCAVHNSGVVNLFYKCY